MTVGERIKSRRNELNLSVDYIAEKLGKNRATIYRYESDEIENLPITILEPLSKVLRCTPAYLMGWEDTPIVNNQINPLTNKKMTAREQKQYDDYVDEVALFFNDETVSDEDKEKLMMSLNNLFWESKKINKKKYAKSHNKDK